MSVTEERAVALGRSTAAIGLAVGALAALSPRALVRFYGIDPREMTGAGAFGWRLFASRNLVIGAAAYRGHRAAQDAFLPVQVVDQLVFAHAFRTRTVPRPTAALAMATSGAIIALDLLRRSA